MGTSRAPWTDRSELVRVFQIVVGLVRSDWVGGYICKIRKDSSYSIDNELKLTTKLLKSSISNFSAWHYRSNLLKSKVENDSERKSIIEKELDLIMNAIFTDPSDQSIWIYYKWIISKIKDIDHFGRFKVKRGASL